MKLTEEEKKRMIEIAKRGLRTKKDEWWARDFLGGWKELDDDEVEM